jgi:hypothetical protein
MTEKNIVGHLVFRKIKTTMSERDEIRYVLENAMNSGEVQFWIHPAGLLYIYRIL